MKFAFIGLGAAGNKAVMELLNENVVSIEDTLLINSTDMDFPKEYKGATLVLMNNGTQAGGSGKEVRKSAAWASTDDTKEGIKKYFELKSDVDSVVLVSSVEGGTGSGATPVIGRYINEELNKIVHIVGLIGFGADARGLDNTIQFFKHCNFQCDIMTIDNKLFLKGVDDRDYPTAEEKANKEFANRMHIMLRDDMIAGTQNIDETDAYKVISTTGYKTIEEIKISEDILDVEAFDKLCRTMILNSKSMKSTTPGQIRMAVIMNLNDVSKSAIDYSFKAICDTYGNPYEKFIHIQNDGKTQYIRLIASGMKLPTDEVIKIREKYKELSAAVDKKNDSFFDTISDFDTDEEDKRFDFK